MRARTHTHIILIQQAALFSVDFRVCDLSRSNNDEYHKLDDDTLRVSSVSSILSTCDTLILPVHLPTDNTCQLTLPACTDVWHP